jgi:hypothetical protein
MRKVKEPMQRTATMMMTLWSPQRSAIMPTKGWTRKETKGRMPKMTPVSDDVRPCSFMYTIRYGAMQPQADKKKKKHTHIKHIH